MNTKLVKTIREAIALAGLKDGMTISFHHHLRNGDYVLNLVMDEIAAMGIRDLTVNASALFDTHAPLLDHIKNHIVRKVQTNYISAGIGRQISAGLMDEPVEFRRDAVEILLRDVQQLEIVIRRHIAVAIDVVALVERLECNVLLVVQIEHAHDAAFKAVALVKFQRDDLVLRIFRTLVFHIESPPYGSDSSITRFREKCKSKIVGRPSAGRFPSPAPAA